MLLCRGGVWWSLVVASFFFDDCGCFFPGAVVVLCSFVPPDFGVGVAVVVGFGACVESDCGGCWGFTVC